MIGDPEVPVAVKVPRLVFVPASIPPGSGPGLTPAKFVILMADSEVLDIALKSPTDERFRFVEISDDGMTETVLTGPNLIRVGGKKAIGASGTPCLGAKIDCIGGSGNSPLSLRTMAVPNCRRL